MHGIIKFFLSKFKKNKSNNDNNSSNKDLSDSQGHSYDNLAFSTPTLENELPEFDNHPGNGDLLMHEDDWRQFEFISKDQRENILNEIAKIKVIYENHLIKSKDFIAFKQVSVRESIKQPLKILFNDLTLKLADENLKVNGIFISSYGHVKNGFSFIIYGINFYGILEGKNITALGIQYLRDNNFVNIVDRLIEFLKSEKLYLVDWIRMEIIDENNPSFY